jgi:hypothetical protein
MVFPLIAAAVGSIVGGVASGYLIGRGAVEGAELLTHSLERSSKQAGDAFGVAVREHGSLLAGGMQGAGASLVAAAQVVKTTIGDASVEITRGVILHAEAINNLTSTVRSVQGDIDAWLQQFDGTVGEFGANLLEVKRALLTMIDKQSQDCWRKLNHVLLSAWLIFALSVVFFSNHMGTLSSSTSHWALVAWELSLQHWRLTAAITTIVALASLGRYAARVLALRHSRFELQREIDLATMRRQLDVARQQLAFPVGCVIYFAMEAPPPGWLLADGRDVDHLIAAEPDLGLRARLGQLRVTIGVRFNNNAIGPEAQLVLLPDACGRAFLGAGEGRASSLARAAHMPDVEGSVVLTSRPLGTSGGKQWHTLTTPEIPRHAHDAATVGNAAASGAMMRHVTQGVGALFAPDHVLGWAGGARVHPDEPHGSTNWNGEPRTCTT